MSKMAEEDVSFESRDEGQGADDTVESNQEVSENVKKKEEPSEESPTAMELSDPNNVMTEELCTDQNSQHQNGTIDIDLDSEGKARDGTQPGKEVTTASSDITRTNECNIERTENKSNAESMGEGSMAQCASEETTVSTQGTETEDSVDNFKNAEMEEAVTESGKKEACPVKQSIDRGSPTGPPAAGGSWGSWGGSWSGWGSSLYSTASATVSVVSGSMGKVIGNVETSVGILHAEDLSAEDVSDVTKKKEDGEEDGTEQPKSATSPGATMGSLFSYGASAITTVVGKTVTGGLDALEVIGKKTMDVIQEGDPGLKKTRAYFGSRKDATNLSQVLREAKEEAKAKAQYDKEEEERQKCHFGWLFEQNQGLAHLEALEILSNDSETKVEAVVVMAEETLKTELLEIKDAFELEDIETEEADDDADFVNTITEHLFSLSIAATPDKLKRVQTDAHEWLVKLDVEGAEEVPGAKEIHEKAMQVLADLTARSIEQFHKTGELLLLKQVTEENKSPIQQATSLSKLTSALCAEVSFVASKFSEKLSKMAATCSDGSSDTINGFVTNIFLEASNSTSYIQDAFQLLLPVLQVVAIDQRQSSS